MGRKSTVTREMRNEIERLLASEDFTIDQIVAHLRELGSDASRSAIARTTKDINAVAAELREIREASSVWVADLKWEGEIDTQEAIVQLLQTMMVKWSKAEILKEGKNIDPLQINRLSKALRDLMTAIKDREAFAKQIRTEEEKRAIGAVEKAVSDREILEKIKAIYRGEA